MKNIWIVSTLVLLYGCSTTAHLKTNDNEKIVPKTKAVNVKIFSTEKADNDYIILGQVIADADAGTDASRPVSLLKEQAAQLGADAIVEFRLEIDTGYWMSAIKASGTAVKFK